MGQWIKRENEKRKFWSIESYVTIICPSAELTSVPTWGQTVLRKDKFGGHPSQLNIWADNCHIGAHIFQAWYFVCRWCERVEYGLRAWLGVNQFTILLGGPGGNSAQWGQKLHWLTFNKRSK